MNEYKQKPKGRPLGRRALLFLLAGVGIGVLLTGAVVLFGVGFLIPVRVETTVVSPVPLEGQPTVPPYGTATPIPAGAQAVGTVAANQVSTMAISADGSRVAAAVNEGGTTSIYVSELQSGAIFTNQRTRPYAQSGYVSDLKFSPDGMWLLAVEDDRNVLLINVAENTLYQRFEGMSAAAFSADGTYLALASQNLGLQWYEMSSEVIQQTPLAGSGAAVTAMDINARGEIALATRDAQGSSEVWLYEAANLGDAPQLLHERGSGIYDLAFHPEGDWLAIGGSDAAALVNITTGEQSSYPVNVQRIFAVDFSDDGTRLVLAGGTPGLGVPFLMTVRWGDAPPIPPDPAYYDPVAFDGHAHTIFDAQFAPSGNLLSASGDGTVRLWDAETGEMLMMTGF